MSRIFLVLVLAAGLSACAMSATDAIAESDDAATATAEGGTVVAAAAESDQTVTAPAETKKKPKKLCYRERSTGSRLSGRRVCKTVEE